ncbi:hypothetical protein MPSEU_000390200 [Mayamaea pseudoterrestris]|nr:hypothetical protein MPSEU_000390200 [Mayamaea pseudoterrestris]
MSNEHLQKQEQQQQLGSLINTYGITALQQQASANDGAAAAAGAASVTGVPSAAALGYESMPMARRLSNFGLSGLNALDRRGSGMLMDDFLGRRASIGFDIGMDRLFDRRDSMDSTNAAALEGAIMDFTRRRYSVLGGLGGGVSSSIGDLSSLAGLSSNLMSGTTAGLGGLFSSTQNDSMQNLNTSGSNNVIAAHHERLLLQQRELEQRQQQLEDQRRLLFANMGAPSNYTQNNPLAAQLQAHRLGSLGLGSFSRNSLGLGSFPRGSLGLGGYNLSMPPTVTAPAQKQWSICTVCNSQAFSSKEEYDAHEVLCRQDFAAAAEKVRNEKAEADAKKRARETKEIMDAPVGDVTGLVTHVPGPYEKLEHPIPLAMETDKDWLTPLHCFIRRHCVEVFTATRFDVALPNKGKRKSLALDQVGIRCPYCRQPDLEVHGDGQDIKEGRERGSTYYPMSLSSIYNAAMNLLQRHLHTCPLIPLNVMQQFEMLKQDDARSGTSKRYWIESAQRLGLVDTHDGIRYRPSALNKRSDGTQNGMMARSDGLLEHNERASASSIAMLASYSASAQGASVNVNDAERQGSSSAQISKPAASLSTATHETYGQGVTPHEQLASNAVVSAAGFGPLVFPEDKPYATGFSYHLLIQMQPCAFTEADRLGKRKGLPHGFPGLACKHCYGGFGSGRFFPSSIKTLSDTSKTLNVLHNHMLRCRKCPVETKELLEVLRVSHNGERSKMKFGSQKAFFGRIWKRLHGKESSGEVKRNKKSVDSGLPTSDTSAGASQHFVGAVPALTQAASLLLPDAYSDDLKTAI